MKKQKLLIFTLLLIVALFASACQVKQTEEQTQTTTTESKEIHHESAYYLHTQITISTYGKLPEPLYQEIWQTLENIDNTMSMSLENAELHQINAAAGKNPVKVSTQTFALIDKALNFNQQSKVFDITLGSLIELWGIGSDNPKVPTTEEIEQALALKGTQDVELNQADKSVFLKRTGIKIDLGAIAKGYAADIVRDLLLENKVDSAILNFGGNVLTIGTKDSGKEWRVGITTPDDKRSDYVGIIPLSNKAIVTSGIYERYFESDGKRYHHILDIDTGYPVDNELASVSIIADSATDCDALSTLVFALGLENGLEFIENADGYDAVFITKDKGIVISSGIKDKFRLSNDNYYMLNNESAFITERISEESQVYSYSEDETQNKQIKNDTIKTEINLNAPQTFVGKKSELVKTELKKANKNFKEIIHYVNNPSQAVIDVEKSPLTLHTQSYLSKENVLELQEELKVAGFYTSIDGDYGKNTKKALLDFTSQYMSKNKDDFNSSVLKRLKEMNTYRYAGNKESPLILVNKNYNLKRDFIPADLTTITAHHSENATLLNKKANQALNELFTAAQKDGINLQVISAYRDFDYQNKLFNQYANQDGFESANKRLAIAGQSEFQTGLAVELASTIALPNIVSEVTTIANSPNTSDNPLINSNHKESLHNENLTLNENNAKNTINWLKENAPKYGFILRYPKGKEKITGYDYKPMHYRYIGDSKLAEQIMKNNQTLEEYLRIN